MSTRHAILTILAMQPDSGYGLAYRNDAAMSPMWSATHSQIYSSLRQLEDEGLVASHASAKSSQRQSTLYSLTDAGRVELERWQMQPIKYPPRKDPFRMRLAHMNEMPLQVVETLIDRHVRRHQDLAGELRKSAAALRTGADAAFEHRHRGLSKTEMSRLRTARAAVYDEIVRSAKFEIESAERLRKVARELGKSSRSRQTRSRGKPTS